MNNGYNIRKNIGINLTIHRKSCSNEILNYMKMRSILASKSKARVNKWINKEFNGSISSILNNGCALELAYPSNSNTNIHRYFYLRQIYLHQVVLKILWNHRKLMLNILQTEVAI